MEAKIEETRIQNNIAFELKQKEELKKRKIILRELIR